MFLMLQIFHFKRPIIIPIIFFIFHDKQKNFLYVLNIEILKYYFASFRAQRIHNKSSL